MDSFKKFILKNKQLSSSANLIIGGGGKCTGGGASKMANGCWETWTGDYTDSNGTTTYCGRLVICKN